MKIKERRFFFIDDIRSLCINKQWFTRGTCDQYRKLFDILCKPTVTNMTLYKAATLIESCSDPDNLPCDVTGIMFELNRISLTKFEIEEV